MKARTHSFTLQLPDTFQGVHPVFHVSMLEPAFPNEIPNRVQSPPPLVNIEGELEYEISEIVDSKINKCQSCKLLYLVRWLGYKNMRTLHSPIDSWYFHLESTWNFFGREPSQIFVYFHLDSTWIPDGLHGLHMESMEFTPFHITLHSNSHLSVDSTWTPPGLQQS